MAAGKPEKWTIDKKTEACDTIIERICEGNSLRSILLYADRDVLPTMSTFFEWVASDSKLAEKYARAMDVRSDAMFDEVLEIADESNIDAYLDDKGRVQINGEAIQRSRLKVDARKWALSKMQPKKYGDKLDIDHTSKGEKLEPTRIVFGKPNRED